MRLKRITCTGCGERYVSGTIHMCHSQREMTGEVKKGIKFLKNRPDRAEVGFCEEEEKTPTPSLPRHVKCPICSFVTEDKQFPSHLKHFHCQDLAKHFTGDEGRTGGSVRCPRCNGAFDQSSLNLHMVMEHSCALLTKDDILSVVTLEVVEGE